MQKFLAPDQAVLRDHIYGLLVSATQSMEGAGRTVCDFPDALPWEFTMDIARQVWDKARHIDIFIQLLAHLEDAPSIERAMDFVLADESTHIGMRSTWLRELPANAPERLRKALEL